MGTRKAIGLIGDVDYLTYGGMLIFDDHTADWIETHENDASAPLHIYVVAIYKVDPMREWFGRHLPKVAAAVDTTVASLRERLASDDLGERASAYRDLISYFGPHEFDETPIELTPREARKRYARVDKQLKLSKPHPNPAKPITVTLRKGGGYYITVKGIPVERREGRPYIDREALKRAPLPPGFEYTPTHPLYRASTREDADLVAHQIGRYLLNLGDFVFSYVEHVKET